MSGSSNRYNGRAGSRGQHSPIYNILYNENNGIQSKAIHTGKGDNRKNKGINQLPNAKLLKFFF